MRRAELPEETIARLVEKGHLAGVVVRVSVDQDGEARFVVRSLGTYETAEDLEAALESLEGATS